MKRSFRTQLTVVAALLLAAACGGSGSTSSSSNGGATAPGVTSDAIQIGTTNAETGNVSGTTTSRQQGAQEDTHGGAPWGW